MAHATGDAGIRCGDTGYQKNGGFLMRFFDLDEKGVYLSKECDKKYKDTFTPRLKITKRGRKLTAYLTHNQMEIETSSEDISMLHVLLINNIEQNLKELAEKYEMIFIKSLVDLVMHKNFKDLDIDCEFRDGEIKLNSDIWG